MIFPVSDFKSNYLITLTSNDITFSFLLSSGSSVLDLVQQNIDKGIKIEILENK